MESGWVLNRVTLVREVEVEDRIEWRRVKWEWHISRCKSASLERQAILDPKGFVSCSKSCMYALRRSVLRRLQVLCLIFPYLFSPLRIRSLQIFRFFAKDLPLPNSKTSLIYLGWLPLDSEGKLWPVSATSVLPWLSSPKLAVKDMLTGEWSNQKTINSIVRCWSCSRARDIYLPPSISLRASYSSGSLVPSKPGQSPDPKPCAGTDGTTITAEDIFYNAPLRRRALKSAAEEYNRALEVAGKYAIHYGGRGVGFVMKKVSL